MAISLVEYILAAGALVEYIFGAGIVFWLWLQVWRQHLKLRDEQHRK